MSLILEALRKSEAQRRLGQAPGLHSPVVATRPRSRVPRWLLPALALMLVGGVAWWLGRMAVPDPSNGTATHAVVDPVTLPIEVMESPLRGPGVLGHGATAPQDAAAGRPATPTVQEPARDATVATPSRAPAPVSAPPSAPPAPRVPATITEPSTATREVPAPAPAPAQATAPPPAPPVTDAGEGLLRLADLPPATRASLPELRISMHVFADDPSRRFAIIDGRRVAEGGLLEGQGVIEAIRRDGIVVDFEGRRVLLPRP